MRGAGGYLKCDGAGPVGMGGTPGPSEQTHVGLDRDTVQKAWLKTWQGFAVILQLICLRGAFCFHFAFYKSSVSSDFESSNARERYKMKSKSLFLLLL